MLQAARNAAAALRKSSSYLTEASRCSSLLTNKKHFYVTANGFTTSTDAQNVSTAREVSEEEIAKIRQRVFGTHIGNGLPSGRKILRKKLVGEKIASYYDHAKPLKDPLIVDLDAEK